MQIYEKKIQHMILSLFHSLNWFIYYIIRYKVKLTLIFLALPRILLVSCAASFVGFGWRNSN